MKKKSQKTTQEIKQETLDVRPLDDALELYNSGVKHLSLRHHDEALIYFQQSLKVLLKNNLILEDLTDRVISMIADSYDAIANTQPDNLYYRIDSVAQMQASFPANHPNSAAQIARMFNNLGDNYRKAGKYGEALVSFTHSINILRSKFPYGSHPYTKTIRDNIQSCCTAVNDIGISHLSLGRYNEALACFDQAFHTMRNAFPEGNTMTQISRDNVMKALIELHKIASALLQEGKKDEALALFVQISNSVLQG